MSPRTLPALALATAVLAGLAAPPVRAQDPPVLVWENLAVPYRFRMTALAWRPGAGGDTLFAVTVDAVFRRDPESGAWTDVEPFIGGGTDALVTQTGCLLVGADGGPVQVDRTCDGGRTWTKPETALGVDCLFERPSDGAILGCDGDGDGMMVSSDDGLTWRRLGLVIDVHTIQHGLAEHPTAAPGGRPRLATTMQPGIAYSDDGGLTWTRSNVWGDFRWYGHDVVLHSATGALYATADDTYLNERQTHALRSDDGGATWRGLRRFPTGGATVAVGPDGAVYVGTREFAAQRGRVWRSGDGGATWAEAAVSGFDGSMVYALASGRDGRLYAATETGVWRTAQPVVVGAEPTPVPQHEAGLTLGVRPNPSPSRVGVTLTLALPVAVRVAVYDALGRRVAVLHDGPLGAGTHALAWDGTGRAAGLYAIRATAGAATVSHTVTLTGR